MQPIVQYDCILSINQTGNWRPTHETETIMAQVKFAEQLIQRPTSAVSVNSALKVEAIKECTFDGASHPYLGIKFEGLDRCPSIQNVLIGRVIGKPVSFQNGKMSTAAEDEILCNNGPLAEAYQKWLTENPLATNGQAIDFLTKLIVGKFLRVDINKAYLNRWNKVRLTLNISAVDNAAACNIEITADKQKTLDWASI